MKIDDQFVPSMLKAVSLRKSIERLTVVKPDLKGTPFGDLEGVIKKYNCSVFI